MLDGAAEIDTAAAPPATNLHSLYAYIKRATPTLRTRNDMFVEYPTQNAAMATHDTLDDICFKTMSRPHRKDSGLLAGGRALGFSRGRKRPGAIDGGQNVVWPSTPNHLLLLQSHAGGGEVALDGTGAQATEASFCAQPLAGVSYAGGGAVSLDAAGTPAADLSCCAQPFAGVSYAGGGGAHPDPTGGEEGAGGAVAGGAAGAEDAGSCTGTG